MTAGKLSVIRTDDVPRVFDDARICELAIIVKLPAKADRTLFAHGIRFAASTYAVEARLPNANQVHREIRALHRAADRYWYEEVADRLEKLSPPARRFLNARKIGIDFPSPDPLRDVGQQQKACEAVARFCRIGGRVTPDRQRPSGRRSRTWKTELWAPTLSPKFSRREAELTFVRNLIFAHLESCGEIPAHTASIYELAKGKTVSGPFARLVEEGLRLVGATHASAVELINELDRLRKEAHALDADRNAQSEQNEHKNGPVT